jgi:hypothetical protein
MKARRAAGQWSGTRYRFRLRSANEDGLNAGIAIGEWTTEHYLRDKGNRSRK